MERGRSADWAASTASGSTTGAQHRLGDRTPNCESSASKQQPVAAAGRGFAYITRGARETRRVPAGRRRNDSIRRRGERRSRRPGGRRAVHLETVADARATMERLESSSPGMTSSSVPPRSRRRLARIQHLAMTLSSNPEIGPCARRVPHPQVMRSSIAQGVASGVGASPACARDRAAVLAHPYRRDGGASDRRCRSPGRCDLRLVLGTGVTCSPPRHGHQARAARPRSTRAPGTHRYGGIWRACAGCSAEIRVAGGARGLPGVARRRPRSQRPLASAGLLAAVTVTAFLLKPLGRVSGRPFEGCSGQGNGSGGESGATMPRRPLRSEPCGRAGDDRRARRGGGQRPSDASDGSTRCCPRLRDPHAVPLTGGSLPGPPIPQPPWPRVASAGDATRKLGAYAGPPVTPRRRDPRGLSRRLEASGR